MSSARHESGSVSTHERSRRAEIRRPHSPRRSGRPDRRPIPGRRAPTGPSRARRARGSENGAELRADVRRVASLLGQTLVRQQGPELLALVERVRSLTKQALEADSRGRSPGSHRPGAGDPRRTADLDGHRPGPGVRHLLSAGERCRAGAPGPRPALPTGRPTGIWPPSLPRSPPRWGRTQLAEAIDSLAVQPVFTAHPTEASRRSVLIKLRNLSHILAIRTPAGSGARARQDRELAELIDLIWQTDELRQFRPSPVDEARNALYYLEAIVGDTIPQLTDGSGRRARRARRHAARRGRSAVAGYLDRRRPRRQPERDRRDHPRGARAAAPGGDPASPSARSTT